MRLCRQYRKAGAAAVVVVVEVVVEPLGDVPPTVVVGIVGVEPGATVVVEPVLPSVPPPEG